MAAISSCATLQKQDGLAIWKKLGPGMYYLPLPAVQFAQGLGITTRGGDAKQAAAPRRCIYDDAAAPGPAHSIRDLGQRLHRAGGDLNLVKFSARKETQGLLVR